MCKMKSLIFALFLAGSTFATSPSTVFLAKEKYRVDIGVNVEVAFLKNNRTILTGHHASSLFRTDGLFERCHYGDNDLDLCVQWGDHIVNFTVKSDNCVEVDTSQPYVENGELLACFPYEDNVEWYGGAERWYQNWPVQSVDINDKPFLTGYDSSQSVAEPFWFNSNGASIHVSPEVPLFVDSNQRTKGQLCLIARASEPYNRRDTTRLRYEVCVSDNPVQAHKLAVERYFGKPSGRPDDAMFREPIYSTWVRYGRDINQDKIISLVEEIRSNNYAVGQIEIDDRWEPCYGASQFDTSRFPDIRNFTNYVHSLGGRVTAWLYPFINKDCDPAYSEALNAGRFIKDANGNTDMNWWCGDGGAIDFTNADATSWWVQRTKDLRDQSGLDSFKFDAGETSYLPSTPQLSGDAELIPNIYVKNYVEALNDFRGVMEVRVGRNTQHMPVFVRMLDKDTRWGLDNGLQSVVTSLFQMNMVGYPFVLPDMIGGNQYGDKVTKELFIRWLQATTFMPALQFSVVPWDFDIETIEISRKYLALHASFTSTLVAAADKAVEDGTPVNTPIWWIDPEDTTALACRDEYLLSDSILVAPILEEGAVKRDVYLPRGTWYNEELGQIDGPTWLRDFSAPLDTLPYFIRAKTQLSNVN